MREQRIHMRYDLAYTCQTCTSLLKGLTTHYEGQRVLIVCYSCAQLCHSKHHIEPVGYMSKQWTGCKCQLVQGFQVNTFTNVSRDSEVLEHSFHVCKARYETLQDGVLQTELNDQ